MSLRSVFTLFILLVHLTFYSQNITKPVFSPAINDFGGFYKFLSSDWMEGREAGEKGGLMAADFIASMMETFKLMPCVDFPNLKIPGTKNQSYFQDFDLIRYSTDKSGLSIINNSPNSESIISFNSGIDYQLIAGPENIEAEAPMVFAGYGISATDKGYDDYKTLDVKNKIVLVLNGFPGHSDTLSAAWNKLNKLFEDRENLEEIKIQTAKEHGALAVIIIDVTGLSEAYSKKQINLSLLNSTMNSLKNTEPEYVESNFVLPNQVQNSSVPCFKLGLSAGKLMMNECNINIAEFEKNAARLNQPKASQLKDLKLKFFVTVKKDAFTVRNVIGMIPGKDKTKNIVLGAHYDHLGKRGEIIYNGADDNASGASGLLSLAKVWAESGIQPEYNLIFASWTAEEDGLLGSEYFVQSIENQIKNVILYINMDMISRSVQEDKANRQLSIGTRTSDEYLREMSRKLNSTFKLPFELDLWDVTGHTGSDYASFTPENIPVMTFNSGLHNDYHTPRDICSSADLNKMADVLKLINNCLQTFIENNIGK